MADDLEKPKEPPNSNPLKAEPREKFIGDQSAKALITHVKEAKKKAESAKKK